MHFRQFLGKSDKKVTRDKTYVLKLEFYGTDRKMKIIIRRIFILIIMYPIFMHFRLKIIFKSAEESFVSVSEHLRIALTIF